MTSTTEAASPGAVVVRRQADGTVRVVVSGAVDAATADFLAVRCAQALEHQPSRLELDLQAVSSVGPPGVAVIAWCLSVGRRLSSGVGVSVATGAGRRALLEATDQV